MEREYKYMLNKNGFLNFELPDNINVHSEIRTMCKNKNAIILSHYYQDSTIQDLSDYLGDSLQLAKAAANTSANIIVFCGVYFMAEIAKILNPTKKVLIPDLNAGCSLADSCSANELKNLKYQHPDAIIVSYINCDIYVKAISDIIVTSSNAVKIINSLPKDQKIIFAPDKNLGKYLNKVCDRNMILWEGSCIVHDSFELEIISQQMIDNPNAKLISHPESRPEILNVSSFIGSTSSLLDYVVKDNNKEYIVATEEGIIYQMMKLCPDKKFIVAKTNEKNCNCSECFYMKMSTVKKLYNCLKYELPEINVEEEVRIQALKSINKMLSI